MISITNKEYISRDTSKEVTFLPSTMSFKEKIVWTVKLWIGFETKIKIKVKKSWD